MHGWSVNQSASRAGFDPACSARQPNLTDRSSSVEPTPLGGSHAQRRHRRRHPHPARTPQRQAEGRRTPSTSPPHVLRALVERNGVDPALVEDVIMGCVMQVGEQGINVGRNAALAAGFPESTVGTTDRPPVRLVAAGRALRGAGRDGRRVRRRDRGRRREHDPRADGRVGRRRQVRLPVRPDDDGPLPEPRAAGHLGRADRREVGHHAARTTTRSRSSRTSAPPRATEEGRFDREIVPIDGHDRRRRRDDDAATRASAPTRSIEKLAKLKPAFKADGVVTAGELVADHRRRGRGARS